MVTLWMKFDLLTVTDASVGKWGNAKRSTAATQDHVRSAHRKVLEWNRLVYASRSWR